MKYRKISNDEYDIHIIKNNDFHTIDFRVFFTENVTKERITYRNALVDILTYATKKYDTKEKLIKKCQDLYSLKPTALSSRNGNLLVTKFGISIIDSEYVEKDNLIDNILLLKEVILNPLASNKEFSNRYFDIVKKELEQETKTIDEEPRLYASINLLKLLNNDEEVIQSGYSDLNILQKMTQKSLYDSYTDLIHNSKIDIFISGNIKNEDKIIDVINKNYYFNNSFKSLNNRLIIHSEKRIEPIVKKEIKNYQQSKLSLGYKLYNLTDYENRYVSFVFNNIFGGGANSLLLRSVREENTLCYYITSYVNRLDNIIIVNSGINKNNYDIVIKLIDKSLQDIKNGKFKENDLKIAKMEVLFELSNIMESNRNIIDYYYGRIIFDSEELEKRIQMINKVSKEDIISFSKKMNLDAIFFLKGDL